MRKDCKRMVLLIAICIISGTLLFGCGTPKYVGTWYNIEDPDEDPLVITEDQMFQHDTFGGTCSESDNGIILIDSTYGESESLTYSDFEGEFALEDEDGDLWIQDYDKAVEHHNEMIEENAKEEEEAARQEEEEEQQRRDNEYKLLMSKIEGTYSFDDPNSDLVDTITLKNGHYNYSANYDNGTEKQSGKYTLSKKEKVYEEWSYGTRVDATNYYYEIVFKPEKTTTQLKSLLGGKPMLRDVIIDCDDEDGSIFIKGTTNDEEGYNSDYEFMVADGYYISDQKLSESELETIVKE